MKRWTFKVDAQAADTGPPVLSFVPPTPANGSVVSGSVSVALEMTEPGSMRIFVAHHGGRFREVTHRAVRQGLKLLFELKASREGTCILKGMGTDAAGNHARPVFTAFTIDRSAPVLEAVHFNPRPAFVGTPLIIRIVAKDKPFPAVREATLTFSGKKGVVQTLVGPLRMTWNLVGRDGKTLTAGLYRWTATVTDWAGNRSKPKSGTLAVRPREEGEKHRLLVRLDPLPAKTKKRHLTVSGRTRRGAEVEILVNGRTRGRAFAVGSGKFTFSRVGLEVGLNRIQVTARDIKTGEASPMATARVTRQLPRT